MIASLIEIEILFNAIKGKSNHPPSLKVGETIKRQGLEWAFCGIGTNAIGEFSKFKIHISTPTPWDIIYGDRK